MSTKAIRDVIESYRKTNIPIPERHPKVLAALEEVEAIETREARLLAALRDILRVGDAHTREAIDVWNRARKVSAEYP